MDNHQNNNNQIPIPREADPNSQSSQYTSILKKIFKNLTFTFTLIFVINLLLYIALLKLDISNYSICSWPIFYKSQYYRIITHHFFHLNFIHIAFNMVFFYFVCTNLEHKIGSTYLLLFIFKSTLLISLLYLIQVAILQCVVIKLFQFREYNFDFYCSVGFLKIPVTDVRLFWKILQEV